MRDKISGVLVSLWITTFSTWRSLPCRIEENRSAVTAVRRTKRITEVVSAIGRSAKIRATVGSGKTAGSRIGGKAHTKGRAIGNGNAGTERLNRAGTAANTTVAIRETAGVMSAAVAAMAAITEARAATGPAGTAAASS